MKALTRAVAVATLALVCASVAGQQVPWKIYLRRAGLVRFGMLLPEVQRALGDEKASLGVSDPRDPIGDRGCSYLVSEALPGRLGLMFENRRVVRVDVRDRDAAQTASGARVGDSEERIKAMYGSRIHVEPHKYDPDGHYLVYRPVDAGDQDYELLFETDGEKVTSFRAGFAGAVAYVEGCS